MAMYQAAVSKQDRPDISSGVMEEAEVCSLPGGLASIRRQFESEEMSSAHTVTEFHLTHRSVQEVSNSSEMSVVSSSGGRHVSQQVFQDEKTACDHRQGISSYENHHNETEEEEYFPRLSTKELAQRFEKTIEEAAPSKKMKIERNISLPQLASDVNVSHQAVQSEISKTLNSVDKDKAEEGEASPLPAFDDDEDDYLEYLPPPPPDLLEEFSEEAEDFPEPPVYPVKHTMNQEQYYRQRELSELKRLCKHIHPDVRKDLERDFYNDEMDAEIAAVGDVQEAAYQFEHTGSVSNESPEHEYLEWDEILRGEVQSMRWMFENKPLDCIKDDYVDNEEDSKVQQEVIAGGDVKNTALMFETQPMDALGLDRDSAKHNLVNKVRKRDVRAAAWLFETKPMDKLNKIHADEEQTKEVIFTQEATGGDVKSVRYMFENQEMDSLGDTETMDEKQLLSLKSVLEEIKSEVKKVIWMFETQCICVMREHSGAMVLIKSVRREETEKGNIKTLRWLFETQPLDEIEEDLSHVRLISSISMEDNKLGDAKRGRWLFETKSLDSINAQWERLQKQQKEEILGTDVRKHCMVFETQPMDTLKDNSNSRPVTTEQIIGGNVRSVKNIFESSPPSELKELPEVGKLNKKFEFEEGKCDVRHQRWLFQNKPFENIKDEEDEVCRLKETVAPNEERGDVRHQKWLFENQCLEDIREGKREFTKTIETEQIVKNYTVDVRQNCWVFETQPMNTLKDDSNAKPVETEEIIGGDVQSARNFFETAPKDEMKELAEVGKLKRMVTSEERGDVRHQKWVFESQPLEQIREEKKEMTRMVNVEDIENVDVSNCKKIFETYDLSQYDESQKIQVEGVTTGSVRSNKDLFESMPLYAIQDSLGHYHEIRTVRREEIVKGDVRSCQWMFETRPIDQFDESVTKFQIIRGITQQEVESGDVKTAKWLFETQPLDAIKYFSNIEDEECVTKETTEIVKGDVKTCKWLFETKPMDTLYEKEEFKSEKVCDDIQKGVVKTCTWLLETQTLDAAQDNSETVLKTRTVKQDDIQGKDVRMARFLFETENLQDISGEDRGAFKRVTEIDIQSGDVSRMKYIFETQSSDVISSTSEDFMRQQRSVQAEDIQKGNVGNHKWLFENQPIDAISETPGELKTTRTIQDIQGGNVDKGRFIFETYSLDKIQDEPKMRKLQKVTRDEEEKGDVKSYAMMFETQPLYAIQDKEGYYHEVTTLTKEEIQRSDVVGTRWLFETKPLDSIRDTDEVYLLKSVTEEDVHKGDVSSARWRFETQPLDRIAEDDKMSIKTVIDIKGGDVKSNKERFESDTMSQKLVRTVSMSEINKGNVRTAKWMFETHTIDQIHSESSEDEMNTVVMEEELKGDVKQSVWLFEKNPLDQIKESEETKQVVHEEIPRVDVKTTTWLFETTPFPDFNESSLEKNEIVGKSVKATLNELYTQKMVDSKGIIIEADEIGDVRMAKYNLMNKEAPQIQKEEIIKSDLQNIMMNLLNRQEKNERAIIINAEERGDISGTVQQLLHQHSGTTVEKEEIIRGDIEEAINNLFKEESSGKRGILIQEDEVGDIHMTIYSLFNTHEESTTLKENIVGGNVKGCLERLYNPDTEEIERIKVDEAERGKVRFYSTCIESGALDYLRKLQVGPDETEPGKIEKEEIIGCDIKGTKLSLTCNQTHIGRLVDREDIVPGDVHNTVKVFMTEPPISFEHLQREEIIRGDLQAAMNSLTESINQTVALEKEELVRGDLTTTLRSLEEAQNQMREVEKQEIIPGNIKGALKSLKDSASAKVEIVLEDLVPGDIKGTLKSLEVARHAVKEVEKETVVKGDVHTAIQSLQEASNEIKAYQQDIDVQGDVKGKIQLLLEPPQSPRMQRRASTEGDVKLSIKALYETQEQVQSEKEEMIKGDVKGTIKSLMETAQRASPTIPRRKPIRKVKVPVKTLSPSVNEIQTDRPTPAVKNLDISCESQRNAQEHATAKSMHNRYSSQESETTTHSQETNTTVLEQKTIVQTHAVKTLKTDFRNLKSSHKGLIRLDKAKEKQQQMCLPPPPSEPSPPLPPPPSPPLDYDSISFPTPPPSIRGDHDLPTPPPPPICYPAKSELDPLPPPPTPPPPPLPTAEQDILPPPPTEQELDLFPAPSITPSKPTKMTVKPIRMPTLCKVPKLEPAISFDKMDIQATQKTKSGEMVKNAIGVLTQSNTSSIKSTLISSEFQSAFTKQPPESPRPPKKIFAPLRLTPPASPPPSTSPTSKFKTPLIQAEHKYRQQREGSCTPPRSPAFEIHMHESVSAALEMLSSESMDTVQSEASISFDFTQERAQKSVTKSESSTVSSKHPHPSDAPPSKALIAAANEKSPSQSPVISSAKKNIISNQPSQGSSGQQQTTSTSTKKKKKRSMATNIQQVTSVTQTRTVINNTTQEGVKASVKNDKPHTKNVSVQGATEAKNVGKDFTSSTQNEDGSMSGEKTEESMPNKNQEKTNSQKAKKVSNSAKLESLVKTTVEQTQSAKVIHYNERKEIEGKVEKDAKEKPVEEPPTTPKKKRRGKNKKDREVAQRVQSSTVSEASTSPTEAKPAEPKCPVLSSNKNQEEVMVMQTQQNFRGELTEVYKEVIISESTVQQQSFHEEGRAVKLQNQDNGKQQIPEKLKDKSRNIPVKMSGNSAQREPAESSVESVGAPLRHAEAQKMLSRITDLQGAEKIDFKSVKAFLTEMPAWFLGPEEKSDLERAAAEPNEQKFNEILAHIKILVETKLTHFDGSSDTIEKHEYKATSEKVVSAGATQRISKITIGSTKSETQKIVKEETKTTHKSRKQKNSDSKTLDIRAPSPSLRMRSASPTFITIESTRRTDSPQRVPPPPTVPTPPPRTSESSRISRASPSPSSSRADSLTRLRNATATLSRGASPDPLPRVVPVTGKKSEIIESPATFHRQIKLDSKPIEEKKSKEKTFGSSEMATVSSFVSEGAQKVIGNKTIIHRDVFDVPEHLGLNKEDTKSESQVKDKENLSKVELFELGSIKKDQTDKTEKTGSDLEHDTEKKASQQEDIPAFNFKDIKNVFEMGEQSSHIKELPNKQEEQESKVIEIASDGSKPEIPPERELCTLQSSLPPVCKEVKVDTSVDPTGFSETKTVTEQYSSVDGYGIKMIGSRSSTTVSKHTQNVTSQRVPFSYADAVKKKTIEVKVSPEASAEELMKNFHKTWTESESVFKSLSVTDSSTKVRDVCSVQDEGVPDGRPDSRQKEVP